MSKSSNVVLAKQLIVLADMLSELEDNAVSVTKPEYIGVFFSSDARSELLTKVPPIHKNVHATHITVLHASQFKGSSTQKLEELKNVINGNPEIDVKVIGEAHDDKGQAVVVELPERLQNMNPGKIFHITISTADGVGAKYSNELLANNPVMNELPNPVPTGRPQPFTFRGTVDTFPRGLLNPVT